MGLLTMKQKITDGTYSSHFEFQQDLSTLTDFLFRSFGLYSTPFLVATKLRKLATELMVVAVKSIRNEEYFTIPFPIPSVEEPSDDEKAYSIYLSGSHFSSTVGKRNSDFSDQRFDLNGSGVSTELHLALTRRILPQP